MTSRTTAATRAKPNCFCDIFESRIKEMACTMLRKGEYNLADFQNAKERETDGFALTMEKYPHAGVKQWIGVFEAKGKRRGLFGMLDSET